MADGLLARRTFDHATRRAGRVLLALTVLAAGQLAASLHAQDAPKLAFDRLYRAYAAGDRGILRRSLRSGSDIQAAKPPRDDESLRKWLGTWDRTKAAFLLELADVESGFSAHTLTAVSAGRSYVMHRPIPLGRDADEDAFEASWHKTALAVLQAQMYASAQEAYLNALDDRYSPGAARLAPTVDPRFALARGIGREQHCQALTGPTHDECLRDAVRKYVVAARVPETTAEANVRAGWVLFQLRAYGDALETIDRAHPEADPVLAYWQHLFRGRILEALDRVGDAEVAYRAALEARPYAQSAGVGLAMTLFKLNRPGEAIAAARMAREQPPDLVDPWWIYLRGDARFIPQWRTDLRSRLRP